MDDDQGAEPPLKKNRLPRWVRITLRIFGVLIVLLYTYFQVGYRLMYEKGYADYQDLIHIARGDPTNDAWVGDVPFEWERPAPRSIDRGPACSMYSKRSGAIDNVRQGIPYDTCTGVYRWGGGPGCSWWRFEICGVFEADDFILTQPELLGRILRALHEPCVFLPTAEEFAAGERKEASIPIDFRQLYDNYACATGGKPVPDKIIINIVDDQRKLIAQYIHNSPDQ